MELRFSFRPTPAEHALEADGAVLLGRPSVCGIVHCAPQLKRNPLGRPNMQLHELPHFVIDAVEVAESGPSLRGRFTTMVGVREGRSWLYDRDESLIGDLESLEPSTGRAAFVAPYWTSASRARPGASMPWVDGYWQAYHLPRAWR